jgi:uncharacterized protein YceK
LGTHIPGKAPGIYAGVRADAGLIAHPNNVGDAVVGSIPPALVVTCCVIDLPLSLALDTALLPIDLTYHKPKKEASPDPDK